jgi:hypothetical protein
MTAQQLRERTTARIAEINNSGRRRRSLRTAGRQIAPTLRTNEEINTNRRRREAERVPDPYARGRIRGAEQNETIEEYVTSCSAANLTPDGYRVALELRRARREDEEASR